MKRIKLLVIIVICLFITNVKADMGAPFVVTHNVVVTNKNGAQCYDSGKKTEKIIPYGTTLEVYNDINGSYIYVSDGKEYNCDVKYTDVSAKNQTFTVNSDNATKITPAKKAIILAKGGLNMRKGPSVTFGKITTIPEKTIITVDYYSGSYWYHTTYNGKSGWITGMDGYLGFDGTEILINNEVVNIYSAGGKSVLGKIPANTEISNYVKLSGEPYNEFKYYVIYNNIKGYVRDMFYKTDGVGKIKLTSDYEVKDSNGKLIKKITKGQELEYTMFGTMPNVERFYVPSKNMVFDIGYNITCEYVQKAKVLTKTSGYVGEGLFGEAKLEKSEIAEPSKEEEKKQEIEEVIIPKEEKKDISNIIIIGLLAGIFACLTALVIIKLVNSKKKTVVIKKELPKVHEEEPKEEQIKVPDKEIAKARVELLKEMNKIKPVEETNEDDEKEV